MSERTLRNFHVPLSAELYRRLREEAERTRRPTTELARNAIDSWLQERRKYAIHQEILEYAAECGGSNFDLDPGLEQAGIEHWLAEEEHRA